MEVYNLYQYTYTFDGNLRYQYLVNTSVENLKVPHPENVTIFIANVVVKFDAVEVDVHPPTCWIKNEHCNHQHLIHDMPLPDDFEICSPFFGMATINLGNFAKRELGKNYKKHYITVTFWTEYYPIP
jgi:hypothetical protein